MNNLTNSSNSVAVVEKKDDIIGTVENNESDRKWIYFLIIECDGCEKDLQALDHKIFISGKTGSELSQSCSYSMSDSSG